MKEKNFSDVIVELRKSKGLTQQQLADKLNITDKAVSKWERGLSYPDITSISRLASILNVDSSYLIDMCKSEDNPYVKKVDTKNIVQLIFKGIGLAMGIAVAVLNIMNQISERDSIIMLSFGLAAISLSAYNDYQDKNMKK